MKCATAMPARLAQRLMKSITASRISWGTQDAFSEPHVPFLTERVLPSTRKEPRSWPAVWLRVARYVFVQPFSGWNGPSRKRPRRSRKILSATGRKPLVAVGLVTIPEILQLQIDQTKRNSISIVSAVEMAIKDRPIVHKNLWYPGLLEP